jgi:hypothetical protein
MIILDKEFRGTGVMKGVKFKQVMKNDRAFLYELSDRDEESGKTWTWYEVFKRKVSNESDGIIGGVKVHFNAREIYPKSNNFGVWAWCISDYERAIEKFNELSRPPK